MNNNSWNKEFLYIGIAASFITLAVTQWFLSDMLPLSLYMCIAWITLELSLLELIKSIGSSYKHSLQRMQNLIYLEINRCNRVIDTIKDCAELSKEYECNINTKKEFSEELEKMKKNKKVELLERILNIFTIIQVVICFVQFPLMMVKGVPNNLLSNKILGVLSLLSFAFLLISFFFSRNFEQTFKSMDEKIKIMYDTSDYYINLLDKVQNNQQVNTEEHI